MPEVVRPSPQHRVELAQQVGQRLVRALLVIVFTFAVIEASDFFDG